MLAKQTDCPLFLSSFARPGVAQEVIRVGVLSPEEHLDIVQLM
jgi:hypothetical protein